MITPDEIQEQCNNWWKQILLATVDGTAFFPKEITRIGKISARDILNRLTDHKQSIQELRIRSKQDKKPGYRLITIEKQFDKIGTQSVPEKIVIESLEDYLHITRKEREYQLFMNNLILLNSELPSLKDWLRANPLKLIEHDTWVDTIKVCKYFLQHPKPNLYIRQLPIDIHTKYINENKGIVTSLLNYLIPEHINADEKDFEKRFNLLSKEQLIRIRFLDASKSPLQNITDISFTEKELKHYAFLVENVLVTENLMNFLTLPVLPKTMAIWSGGGFNISYLRNIEWLKHKQFYYWGDIDAQGFQILNQCRTYFPNTISIMMDRRTLGHFNPAAGTPAKALPLDLLNPEEADLYEDLIVGNIRLEQEKITQPFADERIREAMGLQEQRAN